MVIWAQPPNLIPANTSNTLICLMYMYLGEESKAFPAHQPVLDPPQVKEYYNSFMTSSKEAYTSPNTNKTDCHQQQ